MQCAKRNKLKVWLLYNLMALISATGVDEHGTDDTVSV